jgi:uncharacterized protein (DUF952 family)
MSADLDPVTQAFVFKVMSRRDWWQAQAQGGFAGAPVDAADGYIHLSTEAQLAGTLAKHFAGRTSLVVVAYDPDALGADLRWEPSRGGALFPHLYGGPLPQSAARAVAPVPDQRGADWTWPQGAEGGV